MRRIYFVRHGAPEFPGGEKICLGTTDLPLSAPGKLQACLTGIWLREQGFAAVYSSPLLRAAETAEMISPDYAVSDGLREMYAGEWEGLTFREISERWTELYRRRGENLNLNIPGAEDIHDVRKRFSGAVSEILESSEEDIVIVSHIAAMQSYLCGYLGIPIMECRNIMLPHASCSVLETGETKNAACPCAEAVAEIPQGEGSLSLKVVRTGYVPEIPLSDDVCSLLMSASGAGRKAALHCEKVAEKAVSVAAELAEAGFELNIDLVRRAALLHDIARPERDHARIGGEWLKMLGYPDVGKLISSHHDILPVEISEAAVLSIADRCVSETEEVSIDERFAKSAAKCGSAEAKAAHKARYDNAKALQAFINGKCGKMVIK